MGKITGIAVSNGVAIAPAYRLVMPDLTITNEKAVDAEIEKQRLQTALTAARQELELIKEKAAACLGAENAAIFEAHLEVLADPELIQAFHQQIETDSASAEFAVQTVTDSFITLFEEMTDNPYMQERAADIGDVRNRVLAHLLGVTLPSPALINEPVVVVAHDLTPSDTAQLDPTFVKGIVTDLGGRTAHASIMARSLEIAAVVGTEAATDQIADNQSVIVDGMLGDVFIDPTAEQVATYQTKLANYLAEKVEWAKLKDQPTISADGHSKVTGANIGSPKDLPAVLENGAEGVGLYRTEFLFIDSDHMPIEEEQFQAYKQVLEQMGDRPVTVRTMDIGGDKNLSYWQLPAEENPFLGYRAIRISLDQPDIFRVQLRALLRASAFGNLWIMFPMIATIDEFLQAKAIYEEERAKLIAESVAIGEDIKLGIMIEIPAAALLADQFAKHVDFFSIGTNDLIGYTMAADRGNDKISYLYQPYNPSILRLIQSVIDAAHRENKFVAMCGEMAGDPLAVPLLLGMGLDEFSMSASSILPTRSLIKKLTVPEMAELAQQALMLESNEQVIELVKTHIT